MGGLIAQEIAIEHSDRVKKLILMNTYFTGNVEETKETLREAREAGKDLSPKEASREAMKYAVSKEFFEKNLDLVDKMIQFKLENPQPPTARERQGKASLTYSAKNKLEKIEAETLVLGSSEDKLVPPKYPEKLTQKIPEASFSLIEGTGHLSFAERPKHIAKKINKFLK